MTVVKASVQALISRLHTIGRQLLVLKQLYHSYDLIVGHFLETGEGLLAASSRIRFERYRERLRLYVLSEINRCLDEKEALVIMVNLL